MKLALLALIVFLISLIRNLYISVTWYQIYYNTILSKRLTIGAYNSYFTSIASKSISLI